MTYGWNVPIWIRRHKKKSGVHIYTGTFIMQDSASVSGNTGSGVYTSGTFTMQDSASVSGNKSSSHGGGVYLDYGTFTMKGGTISGNTASYNGGGVYVGGYRGPVEGGTFIMQGGTISGNTASVSGGGVYGGGPFTKTGGIIYGDDAAQNLKNTILSKMSNAVYSVGRKNRWRNATAGPMMNTDSRSFWLNDGDVVTFPSGFVNEPIRPWVRSNFNNSLAITENTMKSSSSNYVWILQSVSGDRYTLKRSDSANTMTLTIRLTGSGNWRDPYKLVINGDSGNGENNWNGTWHTLVAG